MQKYAVNAQLWRRRLQEREEGRSPTGSQKRLSQVLPDDGTVRVVCSDPDMEKEKVNQLLQAMQKAKRQAGEAAYSLDPAAFHKFVRDKTRQVKEALGCDKVQFSVSIERGKVKFKAAKAE